MMRAPSGQPSIDPGVLKRLAQAEKNIDLLSRRLDRQPKIPKPVIAGGAGGWAWADSTTATSPTGWFWATAWDLSSGEQGDPVTLRENAGFWSENRLGVDRPGFYTITARLEGKYQAGAPAVLRFHLRGVADGSLGSEDRHAREIDIPVRSDGDFRASLTITGWIDPAVYDGILPKAFSPTTGTLEYGPTFRVAVVRHA